jgi:hypothetical protein
MDCGLGSTQAKFAPVARQGGDNFVYNFWSGTGFPQDTSNPKSNGGQFFYIDVPGHSIHGDRGNICWLKQYVTPGSSCTP